MNINLENQVALVTGASRGIGSAIARTLGQCGATVIGTATSVAGTEKIEQMFSEHSIKGSTAVLDVSSQQSVETFFARLASENRVPLILINNAGITRDSTIQKMSFEQWNEVIQTNLTSCFNMSRAVIDGMRDRKYGRIVNIGSINGQAGQYGQVNYAAAKSGIHGFTKALAQEGASKGITVNAIAPGYIATEMVRAVPPHILDKIVAKIPVGRLGEASEIARGVLFLASDDAGFITGSTLSINGGQHMY